MISNTSSEHYRVPAVYLTWANSMFLAFFSFEGISNLRIFSVAFSPIPTAPTNLPKHKAFSALTKHFRPH